MLKKQTETDGQTKLDMYIKKANQIYGSATKLPLSILKIRTVNERQAKSKEFHAKMKKFIEESREDI